MCLNDNDETSVDGLTSEQERYENERRLVLGRRLGGHDLTDGGSNCEVNPW